MPIFPLKLASASPIAPKIESEVNGIMRHSDCPCIWMASDLATNFGFDIREVRKIIGGDELRVEPNPSHPLHKSYQGRLSERQRMARLNRLRLAKSPKLESVP